MTHSQLAFFFAYELKHDGKHAEARFNQDTTALRWNDSNDFEMNKKPLGVWKQRSDAITKSWYKLETIRASSCQPGVVYII